MTVPLDDLDEEESEEHKDDLLKCTAAGTWDATEKSELALGDVLGIMGLASQLSTAKNS